MLYCPVPSGAGTQPSATIAGTQQGPPVAESTTATIALGSAPGAGTQPSATIAGPQQAPSIAESTPGTSVLGSTLTTIMHF